MRDTMIRDTMKITAYKMRERKITKMNANNTWMRIRANTREKLEDVLSLGISSHNSGKMQYL